MNYLLSRPGKGAIVSVASILISAVASRGVFNQPYEIIVLLLVTTDLNSFAHISHLTAGILISYSGMFDFAKIIFLYLSYIYII